MIVIMSALQITQKFAFYQHQEGVFETCYTYKRRPVELKYYEIIQDNLQAIAREKQLKGWTRIKKEALINQNWKNLIEFSKNYKVRFPKNKDSQITLRQAHGDTID